MWHSQGRRTLQSINGKISDMHMNCTSKLTTQFQIVASSISVNINFLMFKEIWRKIWTLMYFEFRIRVNIFQLIIDWDKLSQNCVVVIRWCLCGKMVNAFIVVFNSFNNSFIVHDYFGIYCLLICCSAQLPQDLQ